MVPFKSKAQRGYLYSKEPEVAKKFEDETTKRQRAKLPEKAKKKATKKK